MNLLQPPYFKTDNNTKKKTKNHEAKWKENKGHGHDEKLLDYVVCVFRKLN